MDTKHTSVRYIQSILTYEYSRHFISFPLFVAHLMIDDQEWMDNDGRLSKGLELDVVLCSGRAFLMMIDG